MPAENDLEANCSRTKQGLASQYQGFVFTRGSAGFYCSNLRMPAGISEGQVDIIIMDALE